MQIRRQLVYVAFSWCLLGAFILLANPDKLPVVVLIVPFVLLFAALFSLWSLVWRLRARLFGGDRPHRYLGAAVCASAVLFIVLQSLQQLTLRDVATVAAILAVGYIYLTRIGFGVSKQ